MGGKSRNARHIKKEGDGKKQKDNINQNGPAGETITNGYCKQS